LNDIEALPSDGAVHSIEGVPQDSPDGQILIDDIDEALDHTEPAADEDLLNGGRFFLSAVVSQRLRDITNEFLTGLFKSRLKGFIRDGLPGVTVNILFYDFGTNIIFGGNQLYYVVTGVSHSSDKGQTVFAHHRQGSAGSANIEDGGSAELGAVSFAFAKAIKQSETIDVHQDAIQRRLFDNANPSLNDTVSRSNKDTDGSPVGVTVGAVLHKLEFDNGVINVEGANLRGLEQDRSFKLFGLQRGKSEVANRNLRTRYAANGPTRTSFSGCEAGLDRFNDVSFFTFGAVFGILDIANGG
jgi:hypothetical protein